MASPLPQKCFNSSKTFSRYEKILMGGGFYASVITGAYAIYVQSVTWGTAYIMFLIFGSFVSLGYCVCAYCPYIFPDYSDCLFPPFGTVVRKLYKFRPGPIRVMDKIGFLTMMVGVITIPQYWLLKRPIILIVFWMFCLPTLMGFVFYECRRCQHHDCLFNRAKRNGKRIGDCHNNRC